MTFIPSSRAENSQQVLGSTQVPAETPIAEKVTGEKAKTESTVKKVVRATTQMFKQVAKGAVKIVWIKNAFNSEGSDRAYYTPKGGVKGFLLSRESELRSEVRKMQYIDSMLQDLPDANTNHLAITVKEMTGKERIHGKYTLEVEKADTDFLKWLQSKEPSREDRVELGGHFLNGLANLHRAGLAYGDMKPENCLIYTDKDGNQILKLSDFGKAEIVENDEELPYTGNTRFVPIEFRQSKRGDLPPAAMTLIQNLEEVYLQEEGVSSLIPIPETSPDFDMAATSKFRGIEKYVVEHRAFFASSNSGNSPSNILRRKKAQTSIPTETQKLAYKNAMNSYIDALNKKMHADPAINDRQADQLCALLKNMTDPNPSKRPTAEEASEQYNRIAETLIKSDVELGDEDLSRVVSDAPESIVLDSEREEQIDSSPTFLEINEEQEKS